MQRRYLTVLIAAIAASAQASESCYTNRHERILIGPTPITAQLREAAENDQRLTGAVLLFDDEEFSKETFSYIGELTLPNGRGWHIVLISTIWGPSCRLTPRLLVFDEKLAYVGQFSHFSPRAARINGQLVEFDDADKNLGNNIPFDQNGPPKSVVLDGQYLELYR